MGKPILINMESQTDPIKKKQRSLQKPGGNPFQSRPLHMLRSLKETI